LRLGPGRKKSFSGWLILQDIDKTLPCVWSGRVIFPLAVRVVAKNVRGHPVALFGSDGREGFDIAGVEARRPFAIAFGTPEVAP